MKSLAILLSCEFDAKFGFHCVWLTNIFTPHAQRERGKVIAVGVHILHSLCRVGTYYSTHQYKLLVNFSTNLTSGGSL